MIVIAPGGQFGFIPETGDGLTFAYYTMDHADAIKVAALVIEDNHLPSDPEDLVETRHGAYVVTMPAITAHGMVGMLMAKASRDSVSLGQGAKVATTLRILSMGLNGLGAESLAVIP